MTFVIKEMAAIVRVKEIFETSAGTAEATLKSDLDTIDGLGAPWGGDAPGQAFWGVYQAAAEQVARNASQVGAQVKVLAKNTATTIASYQATESDNEQVAASAVPPATAGATESSDPTRPAVHTPTGNPVDPGLTV